MTNMSDLNLSRGFQPRDEQSPSGFRSDARFNRAAAPPPPEPDAEPFDPLTEALEQGFAAGFAEAQAQAQARAQADAVAREGLSLAFSRLDQALEEELRQRLRDTVTALCEAAIAPLALDTDALERRVGVAVAMLARADDDRTVRLNPEDMALLAARFPADWKVEPDPALERGALRVETASGGVEDGPAQWRVTLAEALARC